MTKKILTIAALALAVTFTGGLVGQSMAQEPAAAPAPAPPPKPMKFNMNEAIPDFQVKALDGKMMSFEKDIKKGKSIIINFMQTACSACLTEMEFLAQVKEEMGKKIDIWTVAVDLQEATAVERYTKAYPQFKGFSWLLDKDLAAAKKFGFNSTPAMALISADGKLVYKLVGFGGEHRDLALAEIKKLK